jgi:hypothetical protein
VEVGVDLAVSQALHRRKEGSQRRGKSSSASSVGGLIRTLLLRISWTFITGRIVAC